MRPAPLLRSLAALRWGALFALASCTAVIPQPSTPSEEVARLERFTYETVDGPVSALRAGATANPRVIYVHGSPGDARGWADFLVPPLAGAESIAIDRPGFGESAEHGAVVELAAQAHALEPLLVQRDGRWPLLVGHSLGAPIILRAAADFPDRVGGLVLLSGSVDPDLERLRWYNYLAKGVAWFLPRDLRRSNDEMWDLKPELQALAADLDRVRCPVWIVHGEDDGLVPVANVDFVRKALASRLRDVVVLDDAGHLLIWEERAKAQVREVLANAMLSLASAPKQ